MTPDHPKWTEFIDRLTGPDGCNFVEKTPGYFTWRCAAGDDKTLATAILTAMGLTPTDIRASLDYFDAHGGHCDCEIIFNVDT